MSNRAWVTLATNDSYGLGALVLAHSLRRVGSTYPAVVLITPSVTEPMRDRLRAVFAEVVIVDVLDSGDAAHLALLQRPELGITFTKIHCWNLTQYEKCVFLDADTLVVQNCDELFEREQLSAAPDVGWPDCFNSGVFVFAPSADTFSQLITFAQERGSFDGGDQGLLNSFFSEWARGDINKHLPFLYNVTSAAFYSYLPALKHFGQNLKIIHFIGAAKPWLQQFNFESRTVDAPDHIRGLLQLWWDIFFSQVHSQLDTGMVEVEEPPDVPAIPPHDVSHQYHYQPTLDPDSEFAWHHPDAQKREEPQEKQINITEFHDPWDIYRGQIPANTEYESSPRNEASHSIELGRVENQEEIRKYVWEYQSQGHSQHYDNQTHHTDHHWQHNTSEQHEQQWQHNPNQQQEHHWQHNPSQQEHHWEHNPIQQHEHHGEHNTAQQHEHHWEHNTAQQHEQHWHQHHDYHDHTHSHDHYDHQHSYDHRSHTHYHHDHQHDNSSHTHHYQPCPTDDYKHNEHTDHSYNNLTTREHVAVHHVQVDNTKKRTRRPRRLNPIDVCLQDDTRNGIISESESDDYEEIMPRHPYDGFYLRHRVTIDARGRKICSHQVPPTPSPSSPPDSPPLDNNFSPFAEDDFSSYNFEDQSGVAGNLARVLPGAAGQREALDELTRRQGWEAGNIDYMGADSFDNIWAKISQTLSKPRSSPPKQSPPKEVAPPQPAPEQIEVQAGEVVKEPVSEQVEVAKEAAPVEVVAPQAPAAPVEVPAAVKTAARVPVQETPAVVEAAAPVKATAPIAAEAPAAAVASAETAAPVAAPEVPPSEVPVTVEAIEAEVPAPVEALAFEAPAAPAEAPAVAPKVQAPAAEAVKLAVQPQKKTDTPTAVPESPKAAPPSAPASVTAATPEKLAPQAQGPTDSPPLASTPSKEEAPVVSAAKSEERRKPAGKLKLLPPAAADPLPTPDSELEDAAALAHSIIASELRAPALTATSPQSPAQPPSLTATSPQSPAPAPAQAPAPPAHSLSVEPPTVPTPPVGAVSLAQIGVRPPPKGKASTAAQIESSVTEGAAPAPATDAPKKKLVKKAAKKEAGASAGAAGAEAPVPPPRKKEKKPKEK